MDLELLRYEDRANIDIKILGKPENHVIGPMMLITLMENAFKHGVEPVAEKSWIHMSVKCDDQQLNININNGRKNKMNGHGIGLENLQSQLKHLFGENFCWLSTITLPGIWGKFDNTQNENTMKFKFVIVDDEPLARKLIVRMPPK